jgi:hypothetical protein
MTAQRVAGVLMKQCHYPAWPTQHLQQRWQPLRALMLR